MRSLWISTILAGLLAVIPAAAQQSSPASADSTGSKTSTVAADAQDAGGSATPAAQTPPAAAPAAAPTWSVGPIDFSGEIDGYYSFNFNHPRPNAPFNNGATNVLYNFNIPTQQFSLNQVEFGMSHSPDPVGFTVTLFYGDAATQIRAAGNESAADELFKDAFISFKPAKAKGFEIDFGKFVTSAGAEVIESYSNWNYSRSLLFSWAIPYYHMGLRTSWPMGKHWTGGFQLVNGWNNTLDNNTSATLGANATGTYGKFAWTTNWYGGPENPGTNSGWRELFDTTLTVTASPVVAFYVNYDYGWEHTFNNSFYPNSFRVNWDGIAGAIHITPKNSKWAFSGRYEWFSDPQGFALYLANPSFDSDDAVPGNRVQEITATAEYKFLEGLMVRGEYRVDWANNNFFSLDGACDPSEGPFNCSKHQQTATIAFIAFFGPKR